jgi:adenine deaminase
MMDDLIQVALGNKPADVLYKNTLLFNSFTGEWEKTGFSCYNGFVAGLGSGPARKEVDLKGRPVIPGLIDAHVHIESSLLPPSEYGRISASHGVTTVIADPHEIANVAGRAGIRFMLEDAARADIDIFFMIPSCVPATPFDESAEPLDSRMISEFKEDVRVIGLGEMMNVPGVLGCDDEVMRKLHLFPIVDGHAPLLEGAPLDAYIAAGIQSDHESVGPGEAMSKLRKGMYLYLREGSTEHNIHALSPVVSGHSAKRCSFATDDRHADLLVSRGSIDDCIRVAAESGIELETALIMATLSPAERFGLTDRGAVSPGRVADFSILDDIDQCRIKCTFRRGKKVPGHKPLKIPVPDYPFRATVPSSDDIRISGTGTARVIGLCEGQILTRELRVSVDGSDLPGCDHDIQKVVVCSRYHPGKLSTGLVSGFGMSEGALASSIGHDSHHVIATGVDDQDIILAIREVVRSRGGMAAVSGSTCEMLPLPLAGLMSDRDGWEVATCLSALDARARSWGAVHSPFMYLSFLSLTVIPSLRITPTGVFDFNAFSFVPLFAGDGNQ